MILVLLSEIDEAEVNEPVQVMFITLMIVLGIATGVIILFSLVMTNSINGGINGIIKQLGGLIDNVIHGKLDSRGNPESVGIDFKDIILKSNELIEVFVKPLDLYSDYVEMISKGEMPEKIIEEYKGEFNKTKNNFNLMIDNLTSFALNAQTAASQVASGSEEMSASSEEMAQSANEQASSVVEVSSSMEEMSSSVTQNADNARETASIAEKAATDAKDGGKAVVETVEAMKSIAEKNSNN